MKPKLKRYAGKGDSIFVVKNATPKQISQFKVALNEWNKLTKTKSFLIAMGKVKVYKVSKVKKKESWLNRIRTYLHV